ncbi:NAD-dependent epimerase/dehydratase family protein [Brevundimonas naejangsanensis]|uniref:NAD-dependent epimerase/dehydratase family protein n=1 Tax=Brevundimonas naejangsanensis TaxID=588932 RepID=UPI002286C46E|nr:NAD-dependent epimerase/dehydratase family protein [Brevundimonas naejangsanensis]
MAGEPLPIYGDGSNVRDWLHVDDHARALRLMLERAEPGRTYCVGGDAERTNLQVAAAVCALWISSNPAQTAALTPTPSP